MSMADEPKVDASNGSAVRGVRQFIRKRSVGDWVAVAALAFGAAALLIMFSSVSVCDQQLSDEGEVRRVCRHLALTDAPVVVIAALIALAMSHFFAEISVSGVTLKRRLESVEKRTGEVESMANAATDQASRANEAATAARLEAHNALLTIREYNRVRQELPPRTPERDAAQTRSWDELVELSRKVTEFDLARHLESPNPGERLEGFAWALTHPDPGNTSQVAEAIFTSRGHTQEMGIRALTMTVAGHCDALSPELRAKLRDLKRRRERRAEEQGRRSNRAKELQVLLDEICPE